jgi:hypothetical protein
MPITLVRDGSETEPFQADGDAFWPISFDRVVDGPIDGHFAKFDVVIPSDELRAPPRLGGGARVALLCTHLEALKHLASFGRNVEILFQPTLLARLDRYRSVRSTLVAARALDAGYRITAADLETETGGAGVSADLKATVIGRPLLYDLASGSAIDFGMIGGERGEEPA